MKKKIILLAAALMIFATSVSASSLNGDYKGNPIVIVKSDGKTLETDEVPAMVYDGHTVVPISLLRQLGVSVTWDQSTYSVNVKLPEKEIIRPDFSTVIKDVNEKAKKINARNIQLNYSVDGTYITSELKLTYDTTKDLQNIYALSGYVVDSPADGIYILCFDDKYNIGTYKISRKAIEDFDSSKITLEEFKKQWIWTTFGDRKNELQ